jgi:hypothetical protein
MNLFPCSPSYIISGASLEDFMKWRLSLSNLARKSMLP